MTSSPSNWSFVKLTVDQGVARLWLSNAPVNAMSEQLTSEIHSALDELEKLDTWSVLHIGSDLKVFSAGGDLALMSTWFAGAAPGDQISKYAAGVQRLMARIEAIPQVTMTEVGGAALGGGLELVLATDVCIASRKAKLGLPEVGIGLLPGAGGTQRLTARCGRAMATRLILGAEVIEAEQAREFGIVQWVVDPDELSPKATSIALKFASMPRLAQRLAKECLAAAVDPNRDGYAAEIENTRALGNSADSRERISAFLAGSARK
jgi:enoyl-CoA hydratase/carnithine racemase